MKPLTGLNPASYEHPFDRQALERLKKRPGINMMTKRILDKGLEKYLWLKHTGDNMQITREIIPEVFDLMVKACEILDVDQVPELYVFLEDKIQTFASGDKKQLIALSSGALELLNEQELLFLIGREIGHIKSDHVLYRMIGDSLSSLTQLASDISLGISNWFSLPLQAALMHWYRMSEFTADRAGLLVVQDPDLAVKTFIKLAGLPSKYQDRVTVEHFRTQARQFDDFQLSGFEQFIRFAAAYENHQPFLCIRVNQLDDWVAQGSYGDILESPRKFLQRRCSNCGQKADPEDRFCIQCGQPINQEPPKESPEPQ